MNEPFQTLREKAKKARKAWRKAKRDVEEFITQPPLAFEGEDVEVEPIKGSEKLKTTFAKETKARAQFVQVYAELVKYISQQK